VTRTRKRNNNKKTRVGTDAPAHRIRVADVAARVTVRQVAEEEEEVKR